MSIEILEKQRKCHHASEKHLKVSEEFHDDRYCAYHENFIVMVCTDCGKEMSDRFRFNLDDLDYDSVYAILSWGHNSGLLKDL